MDRTEQDFEKNILPDLGQSNDSSEKELAVFGWELDTFKSSILNNINKERSTKDKKEAEWLLELLQDKNSTINTKKNTKSLQNNTPFNVQKKIEEKIGNENPLANQWRVESYMKVSDFAITVAQQWWFLGRLTSWFS
jgi:hypothetical protein